MRRLWRSTPSTLGLLVTVLAVVATGCATDSGDRENGSSPVGRAGAGRRMARRDGPQPQELWRQYDLNGDGKITRAEFMAVRATCFARYDANGTGMLTPAEVKKLSPPQLANRLDVAFSRLDLDGDGLLSREEFDRESDRLFRQMDTNGDGVLAGTELSNVAPALLGDLCLGPSDRRPGSAGRR